MDKEISDFLKFAIENNRIKDINEAFEEFSPKDEWHKGKIEIVNKFYLRWEKFLLIK